jgi:hypothetical protein
MKRLGYLAGLLFILTSAGCNTFSGTPRFAEAALNPPQLQPGDSGVITVRLVDKQKVVKRLEGVVKEFPDVTFPLRDDGQPPDEKAGDGLWCFKVDVPFLAAPGQYTLEIRAYRSDGLPVPVRVKGMGTVNLQTEIPVIIRYPETAAPQTEGPTQPSTQP